MATPLQGTDRSAGAIKRVRYTHDAMIDLILLQPDISQDEIALQFGFSTTWISQVMNSDAFQKRLADRKTELVDPVIVKELNDKISDLAHISLAIIKKKLVQTEDKGLALSSAELTLKALGFGARVEKNPTIQNNFVVALPGQIPSSSDWAAANSPRTIDVSAKEIPNG